MEIFSHGNAKHFGNAKDNIHVSREVCVKLEGIKNSPNKNTGAVVGGIVAKNSIDENTKAL